MTPFKDISVLMVDDYEINQYVLNLFIKKMGVNPDKAANGEQAVEKYKNHHYNLILMDLIMPVMDGFQATKKIRQYEEENNLPRAVIIAVSANYLDESIKQILQEGFDTIISKPFVFDKLKSVISEYFSL